MNVIFHYGLPTVVFRKARRVVSSIWWRMRLGEFGSRSFLERPFLLTEPKHLFIGNSVQIWRGARIEAFDTDVGHGRVSIGDGSVIQAFVHLAAAASIDVGAGTLIASFVYVTDHDHAILSPESPKTTEHGLVGAPVTIGRNVWIGEKASILKGVNIGENSVVGAGSVVTHDVPPNSVAAGCPARVISRYDPVSETWRSPSDWRSGRA